MGNPPPTYAVLAALLLVASVPAAAQVGDDVTGSLDVGTAVDVQLAALPDAAEPGRVLDVPLQGTYTYEAGAVAAQPTTLNVTLTRTPTWASPAEAVWNVEVPVDAGNTEPRTVAWNVTVSIDVDASAPEADTGTVGVGVEALANGNLEPSSTSYGFTVSVPLADGGTDGSGDGSDDGSGDGSSDGTDGTDGSTDGMSDGMDASSDDPADEADDGPGGTSAVPALAIVAVLVLVGGTAAWFATRRNPFR